MLRRYFDLKNHCCSKCKMLLTPEAFKHHSKDECDRVRLNSTETFIEMLLKKEVANV